MKGIKKLLYTGAVFVMLVSCVSAVAFAEGDTYNDYSTYNEYNIDNSGVESRLDTIDDKLGSTSNSGSIIGMLSNMDIQIMQSESILKDISNSLGVIVDGGGYTSILYSLKSLTDGYGFGSGWTLAQAFDYLSGQTTSANNGITQLINNSQANWNSLLKFLLTYTYDDGTGGLIFYLSELVNHIYAIDSNTDNLEGLLEISNQILEGISVGIADVNDELDVHTTELENVNSELDTHTTQLITANSSLDDINSELDSWRMALGTTLYNAFTFENAQTVGEGDNSGSWYSNILYDLGMLKRVLADEDDLALKESQKENTSSATDLFFSGSGDSDTSVSLSDLKDTADLATGTFDLIGSTASASDIGDAIEEVQGNGFSWFSEETASNLNGVASTFSLYDFQDDDFVSFYDDNVNSVLAWLGGER